MQKERDDIDKAIFEAFTEVKPSYDYNEKLMQRLHKNNLNTRENLRPIAISLILSGIIAMVLYTSNIQFKILDFKYKAISHMIAFQYNYKVDIQKILLGE